MWIWAGANVISGFIFLVNVGFWSITRYVLTNRFSYLSLTVFSVIGPVAPKSHSQIADTENLYFRRALNFRFLSEFSFRSDLYIRPLLWPPLVCDLRTTEVVGSRRLTSPEWVTTGVGPDTRVASAEADLLGRVLRPWEVTGAVSVILSDIFTTNGTTNIG